MAAVSTIVDVTESKEAIAQMEGRLIERNKGYVDGYDP